MLPFFLIDGRSVFNTVESDNTFCPHITNGKIKQIIRLGIFYVIFQVSNVFSLSR